ncbi:MAG: S-layer homology domain-containing protein [Clostridia bacterium]|nr:S-layer homology domain-containing protein [Clostridia bacterium]
MKRIYIMGIFALFVVVTSISTYAAEPAAVTEIDYRISGLLDKLKSITPKMEEAALKKFSDMGKHWSRKFVGKLVILEIMKGYKDKTLKPDKSVNVDEFVAMTVKALGFKPEGGDKYWAEPFIKIAKEKRLIDEGEFKTYTRPINREEMAKIIVRATMLKEETPDPNTLGYMRSKVRDYPLISDKYKQYVLQGHAMGIFGGTKDGKFNPKSLLKRGEAGVVVLKHLDKASRVPVKPDMLELKDTEGNNHQVLPKGNMGDFYTAQVLCRSISKSKGYSYVVYNPGEESVIAYFYRAVDSFKTNKEDFEMSIMVYLKHDPSRGFSYSITVSNPDKIKELHRAVVMELFGVLFGKETNKAIAEFDRYIEVAKALGKPANDKYTFNKRNIEFKHEQGSTGFIVKIG